MVLGLFGSFVDQENVFSLDTNQVTQLIDKLLGTHGAGGTTKGS